uniref:Uncharacterized protein n=1 Tax=viral metagenome TaxID=1070528 RepID=A0A6M3JIS3_9ZZZZ
MIKILSIALLVLLSCSIVYAESVNKVLYLIEDRWEPHHLSPFNWNDKGETIFRKVHVIGVYECDNDCLIHLGLHCCKTTELYTIPFGENKWMTPDKAKENSK